MSTKITVKIAISITHFVKKITMILHYIVFRNKETFFKKYCQIYLNIFSNCALT